MTTRLGPFRRLFSAVAATRASRWVSRRFFWRLDPFLLRISGGRVSTPLVFRAALLETRGARSGELRRHAVIPVPDGDRRIIVASNAGGPTDPAWYHNLRAHPEVRLGGVSMLASEVTDEAERARLWALADQVFPAFDRYRRDAAAVGRSVPLIELRPAPMEPGCPSSRRTPRR